MLGVLILERETLQLSDLPVLLWEWVQAIAPFAFFGLILLLAAELSWSWSRRRGSPPSVASDQPPLTGGTGSLLLPESWLVRLVQICTLLCLVGLIARLAFFRGELLAQNLSGLSGSSRIEFYRNAGSIAGFAAGLAGLIGIGVPFLYGCRGLSCRRIWGLTILSFKEGVRRRILYVFAALLVVLMFASWFVPSKPEDQLKTYVDVVYMSMTPLLLFAGVLVAAFSIPADIRQQTIHTILTKPVERFEVVLGRFFGYVGLMTIVLVVLSGVGVLYVLRGIDPEAAAESLKARDPWYGRLSFEGTKDPNKADSVGREWEYRTYISGPLAGIENTGTAVWSFPEPPAALVGRDRVRCEFGFDIYRTTKGSENRGVNCTFLFTTWRYNRGDAAEARRARADLIEKDGKTPAEADSLVAEKYGFYEVVSKSIMDYHTLYIDVPGALFKNALPKDAADRQAMAEAERQSGKAPVTVRVRCLSPTQYVGVARPDLYFRQDAIEGSADRVWFALNFFKGSFGLWLQLCLVVGLAVCLSTYLSGVVSLLIALLIFIGGVFREFIEQVAMGTNIGGGPLESFLRLATRSTMTAPLEDSVTKTVFTGADMGFRALARVLLNMIPDVRHFDLTHYVGEGFNIPVGQLVVDFLLLVGYLLPWFVLAYFLMKSREVASAS